MPELVNSTSSKSPRLLIQNHSGKHGGSSQTEAATKSTNAVKRVLGQSLSCTRTLRRRSETAPTILQSSRGESKATTEVGETLNRSQHARDVSGEEQSLGTSMLSPSGITSSEVGTLRLGLLNINSISEAKKKKVGTEKLSKFEYLKKFMDTSTTSIVAITEYVRQPHSVLAEYYRNHDSHVILSDPECYRVGLMIPYFLREKITIKDTFMIKGKRKQACDIVCHYTLFQIQLNCYYHIAVVYLTPDADTDAKNELFRRMVSDSQKFFQFAVIGDFNIDIRIEANKRFVEDSVDGYLHQKVTDITRRAKRSDNSGGLVSMSETTIDLVFLNTIMNSKCLKIQTIKTTPSDHFMILTHLLVKAPQAYTVEKFYLDPSRRPAIPKRKLKMVEEKVKSIMVEKVQPKLQNLTQSESFALFQSELVQVLDEVCPLNEAKIQERKIYRFDMSRESRKYFFEARRVLDAKRTIRRKLLADPEDFFLVRSYDDICSYYRKVRNKKKNLIRADKTRSDNIKLDRALSKSKNIWKFIKQARPSEKIDQNKVELNINGKTGQDMVNHMSDYIYKRARLVPEVNVQEHADWIPMPNIDPNCFKSLKPKAYKAIELYKPKKFASLACGPDTISHRHIWDLKDSIMDTLQMIIDKPIDDFHNINISYARLISKTKCVKGQKLNEKSQRPIVEVNILSKYGPIRIFIDQLQDVLELQIGKNQYAFPGRGAVFGIVSMLDKVISEAASGDPTVVALWDFSNAFCTYNHDVLMKIAREGFAIPKCLIELLGKYNMQTETIMKMNDSNGFYFADKVNSGVGGLQGQIGTNITFAMTNDGMEPHQAVSENDCDQALVRLSYTNRRLIDGLDIEPIPVDGKSSRFKYVDDFTDFMKAKTTPQAIILLDHNADLLLKQATSVGLKMNDGKTQIMALNCKQKSLFYNRYKLVDKAKTLGVTFQKSEKEKFPHVNSNPTADACLADLKSALAEVSMTRKVKPYLPERLEIATNIVRSRVNHHLVVCYVYADKVHFDRICVEIRKVIKAAGLRPDTDRTTVYKLSFDMTPENIAKKQIIKTGLKMIDLNDVMQNRYKIKRFEDIHLHPFMYKFYAEFNGLPMKIRKGLIANLILYDRIKAGSKNSDLLKDHYGMGFANLPEEKRKDLAFKWKYVKNWYDCKRVSLSGSSKRHKDGPPVRRSRASARGRKVDHCTRKRQGSKIVHESDAQGSIDHRKRARKK